MEKLQIEKYFDSVKEISNCALQTDIKCECGCKDFFINYYGKRTKGILLPHIIKKDGSLFIEGICSSCGRKIIIYNTKYNNEPLYEFNYKNKKIFNIIVMLNYYPENFKLDGKYTSKYEEMFIDLICDQKKIRLVE